MYLAEEMSEGERGKEAVHFLNFPHQYVAAEHRKGSLFVVPDRV